MSCVSIYRTEVRSTLMSAPSTARSFILVMDLFVPAILFFFDG